MADCAECSEAARDGQCCGGGWRSFGDAEDLRIMAGRWSLRGREGGKETK